MRTAYLGIADRERLLMWMPEQAESRRCLERRGGSQPREIWFWAVLDDADAQRIAAWHQFGEWELALEQLQQCAVEMGPITPPPVESDHWY